MQELTSCRRFSSPLPLSTLAGDFFELFMKSDGQSSTMCFSLICLPPGRMTPGMGMGGETIGDNFGIILDQFCNHFNTTLDPF